jgi:hypothetical protein
MRIQLIFRSLFLLQVLAIYCIAHAQQYQLGPVLWSDTTVQVVEFGSDEPDSVSVTVAYIPSLQLRMLARGRIVLQDFLKSIDAKVPPTSDWKTHIDSACGVIVRYPPSYSAEKLTRPTDPCYAIHLTTNRSVNIHPTNTEPVDGLTLYSTNRSFFEELAQLGLEIQNEREFFRSTMAAPIYIHSKAFKAVYWQNDRLESDGSGTMFAQRDEMFLVFIQGLSGSAMTMTPDPGILPLLIASTVSFIN